MSGSVQKVSLGVRTASIQRSFGCSLPARRGPGAGRPALRPCRSVRPRPAPRRLP